MADAPLPDDLRQQVREIVGRFLYGPSDEAEARLEALAADLARERQRAATAERAYLHLLASRGKLASKYAVARAEAADADVLAAALMQLWQACAEFSNYPASVQKALVGAYRLLEARDPEDMRAHYVALAARAAPGRK